tara:strand:- start:334 stop:1779 length:1446 start_codon:yes stop_codon:yes gene_type:complete
MKFPGFVGPSYVSQSVRAADQRCINWYVEQIEVPGEPFQTVLYPTPGCAVFDDGSATESPVRGMIEQNGRCFAAIGQTLYEIDTEGALTSRGTIARDTSPATFSSNVDAGDEMFITSGDKGYILTLSTDVLTEVVSSGAAQGEFLDGFFLALDSDTSTLKISDLNDGTTWDATQVAQRTAGADPWQAMVVAHRDIWLFGQQTTEVWYNAGTSPFPFAAIPGAFLEQGIAAPFSAARFGNTVMWLGSSEDGVGVVWMANGYSPSRVSTHAVELAIQSYIRNGNSITDAVAFTYQEDGHIFYVLNFPTAKATWVYDGATQLWHERGTWDIDDVEYKAWRPQYHAYAFSKHLVGDREIGTIYDMSVSQHADAGGGPLRRLRRSPHISAENNYLIYNEFQIEMQTGLGLTTGQGSDPQAMLRWSDDGGETWGNEHWVSAGKRGVYGTRAIWRRLGRGYDRVYELAVTDPIPWRVTGAYLDITRGA